MFKYGLIFGAVITATINHTAAAETFSECIAKATIKEFVECSKQEAPEYRISLGLSEAAQLKGKASRRWLNPEFDSQSLFGLNLGNQQYQYQFSLLQTIEIGGRRSARILQAQGEMESAGAKLQNMEAEAKSKTYSKLLRLSQIEKEKEALKEAISTFDHLVGQYANRPRLSPEQEVSLTVFKMARGDFQIRSVEKFNEEREVINELKIHLRTDDDSFRKWISDPTVVLAAYQDKNFDIEKAPEVRISSADYLNARAEKSLENAEFFSEIRIGPMAQLQYDGAQRAQLYGAQISFPFPVWNQNGYGRESADRKIEVAETALELQKRKTTLDRQRMLETYSNFLTALKSVPSQKDLESKHAKVEAQYLRGLVNSALIVEAHRSLIDLQKQRHETEIKALEMYWDLLRMDGRVEEIAL